MVRIATRRLSGHPGARIASPASRRLRRISRRTGLPDHSMQDTLGRGTLEPTTTHHPDPLPASGRERGEGRVRVLLARTRTRSAHTVALGEVVLIQFAAAVDSLWVVPGFGQPSGAVMLRIGMVMIRSGSQLANSYCGRFLLNPVTASL